MITKLGIIKICPDDGATYSGFEFDNPLDFLDNRRQVLEYGKHYLALLLDQLMEEEEISGEPGDVVDIAAFKARKERHCEEGETGGEGTSKGTEEESEA